MLRTKHYNTAGADGETSRPNDASQRVQATTTEGGSVPHINNRSSLDVSLGTTDHRPEEVLPTPPETRNLDALAESEDLWSLAYKDAVESLSEEIDVAILKGKNIEQLFQDLETMNMTATHESAFLRGVEYLRSIQVPLQNFKLALDIATPLAGLEPTAGTVFNVVKGVTAVSLAIYTKLLFPVRLC